MRLSILVFTLGLLGTTGTANAGFHDRVLIALHLQEYEKGQLCGLAPERYGCDSSGDTSCLTVQGAEADGTPYHVFVVVLDYDTDLGISGAAFGIEHGGNIQIAGMALCADTEISSTIPNPVWPQSGSGIQVGWDIGINCQNEPDSSDPQGHGAAVAVGFYVYSYADDVLKVTPRNYLPVPDMYVVDCEADTTSFFQMFSFSDPSQASGRIGFGEMTGYSPCIGVEGPGLSSAFGPCDDTPVHQTTWGGIKSQYKRND